MRSGDVGADRGVVGAANCAAPNSARSTPVNAENEADAFSGGETSQRRRARLPAMMRAVAREKLRANADEPTSCHAIV